MGNSKENLILLGCNHHDTPLEIREQVALSHDDVTSLRSLIIKKAGIREALILNTCNRVEFYIVAESDNVETRILDQWKQCKSFDPRLLSDHLYKYEGQQAVEHLFQVAAGLDSQMIGETEIFGQVKDAYHASCTDHAAGKVLHKLFQKAFQNGKWARTHTGITQGQISLGNVAVELAQRIFGRLDNCKSMVIGSGDIGRDVAKALRSRGVGEMFIASRTAERARSVADEVDAEVIPFANWDEQLHYIDIAIFATSAPEPILTPERLNDPFQKRALSPLFLIDLAVPRDIDTEIADFENVYLYNLEDLAAIANENLKLRETEVRRCREILNERANYTWPGIKKLLG